jgi:DNA-binding beta-propeller fold protein YncE
MAAADQIRKTPWRGFMLESDNTELQRHGGSGASKRCLGYVLLIGLGLVATVTVSANVNLSSPTGTHGLIMVDKIGGYIRFYDLTTDTELTSFEPSADYSIKPHELAISPDHKFAYVTVYGDGIYGKNPHPGHTVAIVDLVTKQMVGSIDVSPYQAPHGIQVDAAGRLYVTCDLSRKVLILDPKKRRIDAAIDVEGTGHWIALLPDAEKLYVSNKNDKPFISVIDLKSRKLIGKVPMPNGTQGIVASPGSKDMLAADFSEPYVHVISTSTDAEIDRVRIQGAGNGLYKIFFSPDGKRVLTCLPSGQVNILSAKDLHTPQRIVKTPGTGLMGFAFSADGRTALVGNHGEGTVSRIDLENATVINTFAAGKGVETLAYF